MILFLFKKINKSLDNPYQVTLSSPSSFSYIFGHKYTRQKINDPDWLCKLRRTTLFHSTHTRFFLKIFELFEICLINREKLKMKKLQKCPVCELLINYMQVFATEITCIKCKKKLKLWLLTKNWLK